MLHTYCTEVTYWQQKHYIANQGQVKNVIVVSVYSSIKVKGSVTALLEYLDLLQCLKITVLGHVHLSACNINNSPHKLGFQFSMRAGDQKLRFDLVWPNIEFSYKEAIM